MGLGKSWKSLKSGISESLGFKGHDKIGNSVGQWMNNLTGSSAMMDQEYANNVALWNMQNAYNTPAAQIARMKAAGIDVNPLTYAVGNGSISSTAGNISAPSVGASGVNPVGALMSVISGIHGIRGQKLANATAEMNLSAQRSLLRNEVDSGVQDVRSKRIANDMAELDKEFYKQHGYRPGQNSTYTILPTILNRIVDSVVTDREIDYDPRYRDYKDLNGRSIRVIK